MAPFSFEELWKPWERRLRHRRHLLLKICLPVTALLTAILTLWSSLHILVVEHRTSGPPHNVTLYPLDELPDGPALRNVKTLYGLAIAQMITFAINGLYFFFLWHRKNHTYIRSAVALAMAILGIALAAVSLHIGQVLATLPLDLESAHKQHADFTVDELSSAYGDWRGALQPGVRGLFATSVIFGMVQAVAVAFWIWLLPPRWRLPNQYEPVVSAKKRRRAVRCGQDPEIELMPGATGQAASAYLQGIYDIHEGLREAKQLETPPPGSSAKRNIKRHGRGYRQINQSAGAQFEPTVRFWATGRRRSFWRRIGLISTVASLGGVVIEPVLYGLTRGYNLRCDWKCHLSIYHPWPLAICAGTLIILVWCRVQLDKKVFEVIRIDTFLAVVMMPCYLFSLVLSIAYFVLPFTNNTESYEYEDSMRDDPYQSTAFGAMKWMTFVKSMFIGLAVGISISFDIRLLAFEYRRDRKSDDLLEDVEPSSSNTWMITGTS